MIWRGWGGSSRFVFRVGLLHTPMNNDGGDNFVTTKE